MLHCLKFLCFETNMQFCVGKQARLDSLTTDADPQTQQRECFTETVLCLQALAIEVPIPDLIVNDAYIGV